MAFIGKQPIPKLTKRPVVSGEPLFLVYRRSLGRGGDDCGDEKSLVNIDAATDWVNYAHLGSLLADSLARGKGRD